MKIFDRPRNGPEQRSEDQIGQRPARRHQTSISAAVKVHRGNHQRLSASDYTHPSVAKPFVDNVRNHEVATMAMATTVHRSGCVATRDAGASDPAKFPAALIAMRRIVAAHSKFYVPNKSA